MLGWSRRGELFVLHRHCYYSSREEGLSHNQNFSLPSRCRRQVCVQWPYSANRIACQPSHHYPTPLTGITVDILASPARVCRYFEEIYFDCGQHTPARTNTVVSDFTYPPPAARSSTQSAQWCRPIPFPSASGVHLIASGEVHFQLDGGEVG